MTLFVLAFVASAHAQAAGSFNVSFGSVLTPSQLSWGMKTTVGSPSVLLQTDPKTVVVMFYETQTAAPTAACPVGQWGIGMAYTTSASLGSWTDAGAVVSPTAGTYYSCVAAHPTALHLDTTNDTWLLYFKAELDQTACTGGEPWACDRYPGVGQVVISTGGSGSSLTYSYAIEPTPVLESVAQNMGYPSVVWANGEYHMVFAQYPDLYMIHSAFATFAPPVPTPGASVLLGGDPAGTWGTTEMFSAGLLCESASLLKLYPGGRHWSGAPRMLLEQGVGLYSSNAALTSFSETNTLPYFSTADGDPEMRHIDVVSSDGFVAQAMFFSENTGSGNVIRLATTSSPNFKPKKMDYKRCP